ncbi:TrmH family RNA methyltransferase [Phnomibacter sp. MR]|uniref:TrmH family RNA methyltransferase n=1 Tax=Phnomibacter sp. MR TaxID=3042318 RepID=UPI003A7F95A7
MRWLLFLLKNFSHMTPDREAKLSAVLNKRQPDLTVVLENVFDPHNVSAVMRTCDCVGIQDIYVLNTRIARHKNWGFKSSRSASKWVTVHQFDDFETCMQTVRSKFQHIITTHLSDDAKDLYSMDFTQPMALVFGNEQYGCTPEMIAAADGHLVIPQVGIIQSLNISVACAVTVYEAFRQKRNAGHYNNAKLPQDQRHLLELEWKMRYDR